jgi:hypothetical protein
VKERKEAIIPRTRQCFLPSALTAVPLLSKPQSDIEEGEPQWASIDLAIAHTPAVDIQSDNR